MVSRRSRSYKDKGYMAAFGQFMLPLAVVMAIALLYFSMKLFFLPTSGTDRRGSLNSAVVSADVTPPAPPAASTTAGPATPATQTPATPATSAQTSGAASGNKPAIVAGPVGSSGQSQAKPPTKPTTTAATTPANTAPSKPAAAAGTSQSTKPVSAAASPSQRYDVQIGAFTTRENAQQLLQKARGQGHDVYINEAVHNGAPYFRVRVKGPAQKTEAQTLSAKLQEQGYPVYTVPIAK